MMQSASLSTCCRVYQVIFLYGKWWAAVVGRTCCSSLETPPAAAPCCPRSCQCCCSKAASRLLRLATVVPWHVTVTAEPEDWLGEMLAARRALLASEQSVVGAPGLAENFASSSRPLMRNSVPASQSSGNFHVDVGSTDRANYCIKVRCKACRNPVTWASMQTDLNNVNLCISSISVTHFLSRGVN